MKIHIRNKIKAQTHSRINCVSPGKIKELNSQSGFSIVSRNKLVLVHVMSSFIQLFYFVLPYIEVTFSLLG